MIAGLHSGTKPRCKVDLRSGVSEHSFLIAPFDLHYPIKHAVTLSWRHFRETAAAFKLPKALGAQKSFVKAIHPGEEERLTIPYKTSSDHLLISLAATSGLDRNHHRHDHDPRNHRAEA